MISKNQIKFIQSLHLKKNRDKEGLFLVEGEKMVNELLASTLTIRQVFSTKNWENDFINSTTIEEQELHKISTLKNPNQVLAVVEMPKNEINFSEITKGITIVLDDIKDPGNLGTIIRICDWFGVKNIICSSNSVDVFNPKVVQATMGSLFRVHVFYQEIECILLTLSKKVSIYGAFMNGEDIRKIEKPKNAIIVLGNESFGISDSVSQHIQKRITIKKATDGAESLNVAVATAILLHEFRR